ncbi:g2206 [Coccomyxa elongata]
MNTGTGTGANIKSHIPGTNEHAATHATGNAGITSQIKEHIPGTTENKMASGNTGYNTGAGGMGTDTGYSTGGMGGTGGIGGNTGVGAGTGAGVGAGMGAHHGHHGHHGHHTGAGVGTGTGAGMTGGSTVDTPDESVGDKIKKYLPGTTENKIHKANKDGAGGVGGNAAY